MAAAVGRTAPSRSSSSSMPPTKRIIWALCYHHLSESSASYSQDFIRLFSVHLSCLLWINKGQSAQLRHLEMALEKLSLYNLEDLNEFKRCLFKLPIPNTNTQGAQSDNACNNTTVFVGGLESNVTEDAFKQVFAPYGKDVHVKIPVGKRCGFVQYANRPSAEQALQLLQGTLVGGQNVRLSWGRSPSNKQTQALLGCFIVVKASSWVIVVTLPPSHLHPPSIRSDSSMETWNLSSFCRTKCGVTCASYTIRKHIRPACYHRKLSIYML